MNGILVKERLFRKAKKEMVGIIEKMSIEALDESIESINSYMAFLKSMNSLPMFNINTNKDQNEEQSESSIILAPAKTVSQPIAEHTKVTWGEEPEPEVITAAEENTKVDIEPEKILYTFERKLQGGYVPGLEGGYFIPERFVRELHINDGDKLSVIDSFIIGEQKRYKFEIIERNKNCNLQHRIQIDMCILEHDSIIGFYVSRSINIGDIMIHGHHATILIDAEDVRKMGLEKDDVIDIAFYENNIKTAKVIWRHETEESKTAVTAPISKKKSSKPKIKQEQSIQECELLKDKTLTIIGADWLRLNYQRSFSKIGIKINHITGEESKKRLETFVKKSDAVVVVREQLAHSASIAANELCKHYGVLFVCAEKEGAQYIVQVTEKAMKEKKGVGESA